MPSMTITLIGGPTALIEFGGLRLLTDPTFDAPGDYPLPHVTLRKTSFPALAVDAVLPIDAVLLSHHQHADNLDNSGKALLPKADRVLTTTAAAQQLGLGEGMIPWQEVKLLSKNGGALKVTATSARHGPAGIEPFSGEVIGFVVSSEGPDGRAIYVTGDTVWYDGVAEVARRFRISAVIAFAGAARTRGPFDLTMDVNDAIEAAHAFPSAIIVPVHIDSWAHFTQNRDDLAKSFTALGISERLRLLEPGVPTEIELN